MNYLTRSNYLHGVQCHRCFWHEQHQPERAKPTSESQQWRFNQSREVRQLVRERFPEGELVNTTDPREAEQQTRQAISNGISSVFNASFIFNDTWWVRCDILQRDSDSWKIIAVKASNSVKDKKKYKEDYLHDLAFQKYVLTEQGVTISGTEVMHTNKKCVYPDLSNLFTIEDITDQVDQLMDDVPNNIETFETILAEDAEPDVPIGERCDKSHSCSFKDHCWRDVPKHSIFTIPDLRANRRAELIERGILRIRDFPDDFRLTCPQRAYVDSVLNNQPVIDDEAIRRLLSELEYPIYFFDFETSNPAIPRFEELNPHQEFPFQYSCHILQSDGSLAHYEYLHDKPTDPRRPLVESLLNHISNDGSVVVYYAPFERRILKSLAEFFPEHSEVLQSIISRLWDQQLIFDKHYKHAEFYGSASLKDVLPVLVPSLSYEDLCIKEGDEAQAVWNTMIKETSEEARNGMINNLKEYCERDTLATVKIHKVLQKL